ncbi:hypothetical protein AB1Y20_000098 [Prymnesium parvum]|uniref:Uncharacterized protein n=1 Tax=Prymnesium parvum TaxID=97485 RepID=A0AB34K7H7_PRYPA
MFTALLLLGSFQLAALYTLHAPQPRAAGRSRAHAVSMANAYDCSGEECWEGPYQDSLRDRITHSGASSAHLGPPEDVLHNRNAVWVLIFNQGRNDEGVYTLQGRTSSSSSYVLAFEETDEAQRFAALLQAEGFDLAQPMEWHKDQVTTFCHSGQFELGIVPTGALLTPPTHNEYDEEAYGRLNYSPESAEVITETRLRLDKLFDES